MTTDPDSLATPHHLRAELGQALRDLGLDSDAPPDPATPPPDALPPGAPIGRYTVLARIGHGGQGEVYSVYDPDLDRRVALKRIRGDHASPVLRARLQREAHALARLEHPNVVRVHDTGTHAGAPFLVMEYKPSQSLAVWLAAERRTWREILARFLAAGRGLHAAHTADIVHRDVKAANIFVDEHVGAVLGDFGLAFGLDEDTADPAAPAPLPRPALLEPVTDTGQFPGTEGYMAPEATTGRATRSSDQYSYCVALFHALFGVLARPDEQRTPPRPGDEPPPTLVRALHRGLARDPAARFPDVAALLAALAVRPRRPTALVVAAALAFGLGLALAWVLAPDPCRAAALADAAAVWPAERRAAVLAGFTAVDRPYAGPTGRSFVRLVDEYRDRWLAARVAACAAPDPAVDACLDHQRARLDRLLTNYTAPDPASVVHAVDAATHLDPPDRCRDSAGVAIDTPDDLRDALDRAELKILGGDYPGAAADLAALRAPPEHPRALWLAAWLAGETDPDRHADQLLTTAMHTAARARDRDTAARAAIYRLKSLVVDLGEPAEAAALAPWIETLAAQWPADTALDRWLLAELAEARGLRHDAEGAYPDAVAAHRLALDLRTRDDGPDHPRVAKSHHNLAVSLAYQDDDTTFDESRAHYIDALDLRRRHLGESHPETLRTAFGLAQTECQHFDRYTDDDPTVVADCTADLAGNLEDYRRQPALDPRGLVRRAAAVAYHAQGGTCRECADEALELARSTLAGLADVDLRERSELLFLAGDRDLARDDPPAALASFTTGLALWEAADRHDEPYFQLLDSAVAVALDMHPDSAVDLLLARTPALVAADCGARRRHADQLVDLAAAVAPARRADDLRRAAATLLPCP